MLQRIGNHLPDAFGDGFQDLRRHVTFKLRPQANATGLGRHPRLTLSSRAPRPRGELAPLVLSGCRSEIPQAAAETHRVKVRADPDGLGKTNAQSAPPRPERNAHAVPTRPYASMKTKPARSQTESFERRAASKRSRVSTFAEGSSGITSP